MAPIGKFRPPRGNHLLSLLSEDAHAALLPMLQPVQLGIKEMLHERGKPFSPYVYFPVNCAISAILPLLDGAAVEVGSVGNEGFSGVEMLTGADAPVNTYFCQIPGQAIRMAVADFMPALDTVPGLRKAAFGYLQGFLAQMAQSAACNGQHSVEARFARWMLITHDRVDGDEFKLTQEFMAQMLGVQRPSVSLVANQFQQAGLLRYSRGNVEILNRQGIEDVACECYFDVRGQFQRLMGIERG